MMMTAGRDCRLVVLVRVGLAVAVALPVSSAAGLPPSPASDGPPHLRVHFVPITGWVSFVMLFGLIPVQPRPKQTALALCL